MSRHLTKDVGLLSIGRVVGQVANALVGLVIVRHLTQEQYGTYRQAFLLYFTLSGIGGLGLIESIYYFVPTFPEYAKRLVRRAALLVGLIQLAAGLLLAVFAARIGQFFQNAELTGTIALLAVAIGVTALGRAWEIQLVSERRAMQASAVILIFEIVKCALLGMALVLHSGVMGLIWALTIAGVLKLAGYLWTLRGEEPAGAPSGRSMPGVREQLGYSMGLWIPGVLAFASTQAHQYIVGHYYRPEEYAIYAVACFQVPFLGTFGSSIKEVFLVHATEYWAQGKRAEFYQLWSSTWRKAMLLFMPLAIGMAVLAKPLITTLFTARYQAAAPLFAVIVFSLVLSVQLQDSVFRACASMRTYSAFHISRGVLSVLMGLLGVKYLGLWGAAISAPLALAIINLAQLIPIARLMKVGMRRLMPWYSLGKILLASLLAGGVALLVTSRIERPLTALIAGGLAYAVVNGILILAFGEIKLSQVQELLRPADPAVSESEALRAKAN